MKKAIVFLSFLISMNCIAGTHFAIFTSSLYSVDYNGSPTWRGKALDAVVTPQSIEDQHMFFVGYNLGQSDYISKYKYQLKTLTPATLVSEESNVWASGTVVEAIPIDSPLFVYGYRGDIGKCKDKIRVELGVAGIVDGQITSFAPDFTWKTIGCPSKTALLKELYVNQNPSKVIQILDMKIVDSGN